MNVQIQVFNDQLVAIVALLDIFEADIGSHCAHSQFIVEQAFWSLNNRFAAEHDSCQNRIVTLVVASTAGDFLKALPFVFHLDKHFLTQ
ncbi:hypothetical protein A8M58_09380 [Yersinia pestis]|nr:hypothetical protein A8M58_09380 [Yersinia pestis]